MKRAFVILLLAQWASFGSAQEPIPQDQLQKYAPRFVNRALDFTDLPLKMEVDPLKAFGMTIKNYGAVVIPDKGLTKEVLAKVGKTVVPVGQLWLSRLTPAVKDAATPNDKSRLVTVTLKDEDHRLPLLLLGVRKNAEQQLELVVYARGSEPLLTLPLKKQDNPQGQPLEVNLRQGSATLGLIDLYLLGQYQATLPVGEQES